jgi:chromosome segregation ATPase
VLADAVDGFGGKVTAGNGTGPAQGLVASLDVVTPAAAPASEGLLDKIRGFISSPLGYISVGVFTLLAVAGFLFRPRKTVSGEKYHLPNRRKSIDETLKDIQRRLEKVDENQHELVRKPPVLRTFKGQIDAFNSRLNHLEAQLNSLQLHAAKQNDSLQDLDRGQKEVKSHVDKGFAGAVLDLKSAVDQAKSVQTSKLDEVLSSYGKQALDLQGKLSELEKHGDEQLQAAVANLTAALNQVQTAIAEKKVDLKPVEAGLSELRESVGGLHEAHDGLLEKLADAIEAAKPKDLDERLDHIARDLESVSLRDYGQPLAEIRTGLAEFAKKAEEANTESVAALTNEFNALRESSAEQAAALQAKLAELLSNPGESEAKLNQVLAELESAKQAADKRAAGLEEKLSKLLK